MERRRRAQRRKGGRGRGGGGHNQNGRGQQAGANNDAHKRGRSKQLKAPRLTAIALGWNSAESNKRRWSARNTPSFVRQVPSSVEIDGRTLEGGGQIIRNGLAYASILGVATKVHHIRGGRSKPGLRNQHVVGAQALASMCNAETTGLAVQSEELGFVPNAATHTDGGSDAGVGNQPGDRGAAANSDDPPSSAQPASGLKVVCSGAGSVSLLIQSAMPCMLCFQRHSKVTFVGGTIVNFSPSIEYLRTVMLPILHHNMGVRFEIDVVRHGFNPAGGGEVVVRRLSEAVSIHRPPECSRKIHPLILLQQGNLRRLSATIHIVGVDAQICAAHAAHLENDLRKSFRSIISSTMGENAAQDAPQPEIVISKAWTLRSHKKKKITDQAIVCAAVFDSGCVLGSSALNTNVKDAEFAKRAARDLAHTISSGVCVDEHAQDQVIIFMALAPGPSVVRVAHPPYSSLHFTTAEYVAEEVFRVTRYYEMVVPTSVHNSAGDASNDGGHITTFVEQFAAENRMHPRTIALLLKLCAEGGFVRGARYVVCDGCHISAATVDN